MPDERLDSIQQGLHAPAESPSGAAAEKARQKRLSEDPPIESAMGGSSDESSPGEEAQVNAARRSSEDGRERADE